MKYKQLWITRDRIKLRTTFMRSIGWALREVIRPTGQFRGVYAVLIFEKE